MSEETAFPTWLEKHRATRPYGAGENAVLPGQFPLPIYSRSDYQTQIVPKLLQDQGFNNHELNDGVHVSPYDEGRVEVGVDNLQVNLIQGVNEDMFRRVLSRTLKATTGVSPNEPIGEGDWEEMMRGGLQSALETQTIVFEVIGASRALTHQLVRSRKAGFHQQSQRATWYGDRPNFRMPMSVFRASEVDPDKIWEAQRAEIGGGRINWPVSVRRAWEESLLMAWRAYQIACEAGISYQDARYILPEGTTNYIICEYTVREFINVFAYRGCSGFLWEMVNCMRKMRSVLLADHPFLTDYIKISCEKPVGKCSDCDGTGKFGREGTIKCNTCGGDGKARKCTFQGWENVEGFCSFPWAKQSNRTFLPTPRLRIGG